MSRMRMNGLRASVRLAVPLLAVLLVSYLVFRGRPLAPTHHEMERGTLAQNPSGPEPVSGLDTPDSLTSRTPTELGSSIADGVQAPNVGRGLVTVRDEAGMPVQNATVTLVSSRRTLLGQTPASGTIDLMDSIPTTTGDCLVATCDGFSPGETFVSSASERRFDITLGAMRKITGRVEAVVGLVDDWNEIHVLAIPYGVLEGLLNRGSANILADPRILGVSCSQGGAYELSGLRRDKDYRLVAGGSGWVLDGLPQVAPLDAEPAIVFITPLYATRLCFVDTDNLPLTVIRLGDTGRGIRSSMTTPGGSISPANPVALLLAGMPDGWERNSWSKKAIVAVCNSDFADALTAHVVASFWGYEPVALDVQIPRLPLVVSDQNIVLRQTADAWGRIRVLFPAPLQCGHGSSPVGSLVLRDSTASTITIPIDAPQDSDGVVVGPVPTGHYEWTFKWSITLGKNEERPMTRCMIAPDRDTAIDLTASSRGSMRIMLRDDRGADYAGPAEFDLRNGDAPLNSGIPERGENVHFRSAPYVIFGLEPGRMRLSMRAPGRIVGGSVVVEVPEGDCLSVPLSYEKRAPRKVPEGPRPAKR